MKEGDSIEANIAGNFVSRYYYTYSTFIQAINKLMNI